MKCNKFNLLRVFFFTFEVGLKYIFKYNFIITFIISIRLKCAAECTVLRSIYGKLKYAKNLCHVFKLGLSI